jgi:2Fe-2S ferredoxin
MPNIKFILFGGEARVVDAPVGTTAMQAATANMITGIDADCGGACACATCHVHVDPEWMDRLDPVEAMEADMLECAFEPDKFSRLSCQVRMSAELDGLVLHVPPRQG